MSKYINREEFAQVQVPYNGVDYLVRLIGHKVSPLGSDNLDPNKKQSTLKQKRLNQRYGWEILSIVPMPDNEKLLQYVSSIAMTAAVPMSKTDKNKQGYLSFSTMQSWKNSPRLSKLYFSKIIRYIIEGKVTPNSWLPEHDIQKLIVIADEAVKRGLIKLVTMKDSSADNEYMETSEGIKLVF